jgi:hypothetical protein
VGRKNNSKQLMLNHLATAMPHPVACPVYGGSRQKRSNPGTNYFHLISAGCYRNGLISAQDCKIFHWIQMNVSDLIPFLWDETNIDR